jgi:hypothetical protein
MLSDETQGRAFAHTADKNRRMRSAERRWVVDRPLRTVVASLERRLVTCPHMLRQSQSLLEPLEALADGRQVEIHRFRFVFLVAGAQAEPGAAAGKHVECGDRPDEQSSRPVSHRRHHGAEADPRGAGGEVTESGIRLEHLGIGGTGRVCLKKVVGDPHCVESGLLCALGDAHELVAETARVTEP